MPPDAVSSTVRADTRAPSRARLRELARGIPGFVFAVAGSLGLIGALWLLANGAASSRGEPFRFSPPPERPIATTFTPTPAPERLR